MIISGQEDDDVQVRRCMSGREHIEELKYDFKKLLYWLLSIYTRGSTVVTNPAGSAIFR